jgi:hypothetical protein
MARIRAQCPQCLREFWNYTDPIASRTFCSVGCQADAAMPPPPDWRAIADELAAALRVALDPAASTDEAMEAGDAALERYEAARGKL